MADFAAHTLFGEMVRVEDSPWREFPVLRNWGLQGPDILFFRKVIMGRSPFHDMGSRIHQEKIGEFFRCLASQVASLPQEQRERGMAYFYGFLCHYSLDSTIHPYVYYHQERLSKGFPELTPGAIHCQIETDIDIDLYSYLRKEPVRRFRPGKYYDISPEGRSLIGGLLSAAVFDAYGQVVPAGEIAASVGDTLLAQKAVFAPTKLAYAAAGLAETLLGRQGGLTSHVKAYKPRWDSLNLRKASWHSPWEPERQRTDSVPDLLELARLRAEELCAAYARMFREGEIVPWSFPEDFSGRRCQD